VTARSRPENSEAPSPRCELPTHVGAPALRFNETELSVGGSPLSRHLPQHLRTEPGPRQPEHHVPGTPDLLSPVPEILQNRPRQAYRTPSRVRGELDPGAHGSMVPATECHQSRCSIGREQRIQCGHSSGDNSSSTQPLSTAVLTRGYAVVGSGRK
jgi:hypothetical protein